MRVTCVFFRVADPSTGPSGVNQPPPPPPEDEEDEDTTDPSYLKGKKRSRRRRDMWLNRNRIVVTYVHIILPLALTRPHL